MYYYGFDPTYILVIIGIIITMWAQGKMKTTFTKYSRVRSMSGMTGQEVARRILMANGIFDVTVEPVAGQLTDHYDPRSKVVKLSEVIYNSTRGISAAEAPFRYRTGGESRFHPELADDPDRYFSVERWFLYRIQPGLHRYPVLQPCSSVPAGDASCGIRCQPESASSA